ncbi:hypothetical protein Q1M64_14335 (plasmid) [Sinorhizobium meliloti]|nr:hypothetical protein Q1M64_14335 [Sinorhizobium meliloti]
MSTGVSRYFSCRMGNRFLVSRSVAQSEFERPNEGKILTGDLSEITPSLWGVLGVQIEAMGG